MSTVLIMRSCGPDLRSYNEFQWPEAGPVAAPAWEATENCGNGLHGFLWGEGDYNLANKAPDAKWLVVETDGANVIDLGGKVKFPSGTVVFCGEAKSAAAYIQANGGAGKKVIHGTATAGYAGTATAGYAGTATAGDAGTATAGDAGTATAEAYGTATAGARGTATAGAYGTATAGDAGTATAGDASTATAGDTGTATAGAYGTATAGAPGTATAGAAGTATAGAYGTATAGARGTATAGYAGTATAGYGGVICIQFWTGTRYKAKIAQVKDEDGDGQLEPNQAYKLNEAGEFVLVEGGAA